MTWLLNLPIILLAPFARWWLRRHGWQPFANTQVRSGSDE